MSKASGKESKETRMEIDLTRDDEVPQDVRSKIAFISNTSKERSLDEWFLSGDPAATTDEMVPTEDVKNTPVAKNAAAIATSSSKNLSSLSVTSTAGLHQPITSVQDVGDSSEEKKGLPATISKHAQPTPSSSDAGPSSLLLPTPVASSSDAGPSSLVPASKQKENRVVPPRGNDDSDSDSSVVSGIECFVNKSPDREIID